MGKPAAAGDVRAWDEEAYRSSILQERGRRAKTVFKTAFAPSSANPCPEVIVVASNDGSVSPYAISSCVAAATATASACKVPANNAKDHNSLSKILLAEPLHTNQGHIGPAYDVKFYGDGEDALLLSCGDDGRVRGWSWREFLSFPSSTTVEALNPTLDLVNPQHRGPWDALSPVPENNAIATNVQERSIFSAAGDAHAYSWDVETSKLKMTFKGHKDYLHCIAARKSSNQGTYVGGWELGLGIKVNLAQSQNQNRPAQSLTCLHWTQSGVRTGQCLSICKCLISRWMKMYIPTANYGWPWTSLHVCGLICHGCAQLWVAMG